MSNIPAAAIPTAITPPQIKTQFTDKDGNLTNAARTSLQQTRDYVVNTARSLPANATTMNNAINLSLLSIQPVVTQYGAYDQYGFVADTSSTGLVSAQVQTASGTLATLKVYKANGSAQATSGDITAGLHYWLTYVPQLNNGAGGFVLR